MKREDAEEYTQSLGQIVGGSWRQVALAKRLGVPKALGLSLEEWVNKRLGGYIRMSVEDRRKAAAELAGEGESNRGIAAVLGVDEITVRRDSATNVAPADDDASLNGEGGATNAAPLDALAALGASEKVKAIARKLGKQDATRQQWAFGASEEGFIYRFPEVQQGTYEQLNDTWGRLVPVGALANFAWFRHCKVRQLALFGQECA